MVLMQGEVAGDWIILRTSSNKTLPLSKSLAADGYRAWTPIETVTIPIPRSSARREGQRAIMPSYVFVGREHLFDLLRLAALPEKPRRGDGCKLPAHAEFRIMRYADRIPVIADRHLAALRRLEAKRTPVGKAVKPYSIGAIVRAHDDVASGSFRGMVGRVEQSDCGTTMVWFGPFFTDVKIPTSLLSEDELSAAAKPE